MKKIAIVGTSPTSRDEAPFKDQTWSIWSLGRNFEIIPRYDTWFELHSMDVLAAVPIHPDYEKFLRENQGQLILGHPWGGNPNAMIYPKEEVIKEFDGRYFTSSIALMLALAIQQKADEIGIWGVDMAANDEYAYQRPCCEYYIGIARGRGIKVTIAKDSPLVRAGRIYALEEVGISREIVVRKNELRKVQAEIEQAAMKREYFKGQKDLLDDLETRWG